jgi:hypothetical protein
VIYDEPAHEGTGKFANEKVEVEVTIKVADEDGPSATETLVAAQQALHAALVATGYYAVEQTLDTWHEARASESRAGKEF